MDAKGKKLSVMVDTTVYAQMETYCEIYDIDENDLMNDAMYDFIQEHKKPVEDLINGYAEMAQLNAEIANEFSACEAEAYLRIFH